MANKSLVLVHTATPEQQKFIDGITKTLATAKSVDEWNTLRKQAVQKAAKKDQDTYFKTLHAIDGRGLIVQVLGQDKLDAKGVAIRN